MNVEPATITKDVRRATRVCSGGRKRLSVLRIHAHRATRHRVRQALRARPDFDAFIINPKRVTGWEIA